MTTLFWRKKSNSDVITSCQNWSRSGNATSYFCITFWSRKSFHTRKSKIEILQDKKETIYSSQYVLKQGSRSTSTRLLAKIPVEFPAISEASEHGSIEKIACLESMCISCCNDKSLRISPRVSLLLLFWNLFASKDIQMSLITLKILRLMSVRKTFPLHMCVDFQMYQLSTQNIPSSIHDVTHLIETRSNIKKIFSQHDFLSHHILSDDSSFWLEVKSVLYKDLDCFQKRQVNSSPSRCLISGVLLISAKTADAILRTCAVD